MRGTGKILAVGSVLVVLAGCKQGDKFVSFSAQQQAATTNKKVVALDQSVATPSVQETKWLTVDEFSYQWRTQTAHFALELPEHYGNPGDFIRIRIKVDGQQEFILQNSGRLDQISR